MDGAMKFNKKSILCFAAMLAVMVLIFNFSSEEGIVSTGTSTGVTKVASRVLFSDFEKMQPEQQSFIVEGLQHFVRKLAHFSVYMLLGLFSYAAVLLSTEKLRCKWLLAIVICVSYAAVDEIHQLFVPGRTAKVTDVLIDAAGSIVGMLFLRIAILCWTYFKNLISNHHKKSTEGR